MSPILLILLAVLVGLLIGGFASSREQRHPDGKERRAVASRAVRPVARVISAVVEPLFYWLGLLDPNGHPDNSKIMYTLAVMASLFVTIDIGHDLKDATWPFIGLVCAVLLGAAGPRVLLKGLRVWKPGAFKEEDAAAPVSGVQPPVAGATGAGVAV